MKTSELRKILKTTRISVTMQTFRYGGDCSGMTATIRMEYPGQFGKAYLPHEYLWPMSEFEAVLGRMLAAIDKGSFNKDSASFKLTCKALGIAHTYKAMREFFMAGDALKESNPEGEQCKEGNPPLRFCERATVKLLDREKNLVTWQCSEAFEALPFTIHREEGHSDYVLSVQGMKLMNGLCLDRMKLAAKEFNALPVNWNQPYTMLLETLSAGGKNVDWKIQRKCSEIVRDYGARSIAARGRL